MLSHIILCTKSKTPQRHLGSTLIFGIFLSTKRKKKQFEICVFLLYSCRIGCDTLMLINQNQSKTCTALFFLFLRLFFAARGHPSFFLGVPRVFLHMTCHLCTQMFCFKLIFRWKWAPRGCTRLLQHGSSRDSRPFSNDFLI